MSAKAKPAPYTPPTSITVSGATVAPMKYATSCKHLLITSETIVITGDTIHAKSED